MISNDKKTPERRRVWIFGYTTLSHEEMKEIFQGGGLYQEGGDEYLIIRADFVKDDKGNDLKINDQDCNIVIPVDALDDEYFVVAKERIADDLRTTIIMEAWDVYHVPWPPHVAHGFQTLAEWESLPDEESHGRQHASPGSNKWG